MNESNSNFLNQWHISSTQISTISAHEIHVWRTSLKVSPAREEQLLALLSTEEHARALRFKFEHHRRRFIVAKGVLRLILARYIGETPDKISFALSAHGKPELSNPKGYALQFNSSDSNEMALYAISLAEPVGVDIESIQKHIEAEAIAERFFSDHEIKELSALSPPQKTSAFFNIWTRKEAFIKALGLGLSFPLKDFDVSSGELAALLAVRNGGYIAEEWSLFNLKPGLDYAGAAAIKGHNKILKLWEFKE
ncbi:MAG TPA: 4'-phosphopantetheinyl transferase superfamily protein [Gammaproteobacteria bacterium]|nr:4'-phosphopantetheinyl transferase superfamily protein [Gammaproteobacteria bacterium]